jgi:hypothetical protein
MRALLIGLLWTLAILGGFVIAAVIYHHGNLPSPGPADWVETLAFWFVAWLAISVSIAWRTRR